MRRFAIATTLILLLSGCIKAVDSEDKFRYNLVVDGRIEQGRGATVMLSQSMPYREEYDEEAFREVVIKWAKVTIIHNDREEVLVGRRVEDYPTGYIYSGSDILGEVGESYTLRVEYSKRVWEATTTIVEPIELHDIEIIAIDEDNKINIINMFRQHNFIIFIVLLLNILCVTTAERTTNAQNYERK